MREDNRISELYRSMISILCRVVWGEGRWGRGGDGAGIGKGESGGRRKRNERGVGRANKREERREGNYIGYKINSIGNVTNYTP